jgi:hypothetical protein
VENVEPRIFAFGPTRFAFDLNLSDERRDGLDGIWHRKQSHQRHACIGQSRVNALPDRPDFRFAGQSGKGLDRIIRHHIIKLSHQSLIGSEHDRADRAGVGLSFPFYDRRRWLAFPKARAQSQFHRAIIITQGANRLIILPYARSGQSLHRADDRLQIAGTADFSGQACRGIAHGFSFGSPRILVLLLLAAPACLQH